MTAAYSPDLAPDLEADVVRWQPRSSAFDRRDLEQKAVVAAGLAAVAALVVGIVAFTALAAARVAAGRASGPRRIRRRLRRPF